MTQHRTAALLLMIAIAASIAPLGGAQGGKIEPTTLIAWPYIQWDPSKIKPGSITYLDAGISIVTLGWAPSSYSVEVVIYDPYPSYNGAPKIVSSSLIGCNNVDLSFSYDENMQAWIFRSGRCSAWLQAPGQWNLGITAMWKPVVPGNYTATVTACVYEFPGGCESALAVLEVSP
jgi:hypothetical protein